MIDRIRRSLRKRGIIGTGIIAITDMNKHISMKTYYAWKVETTAKEVGPDLYVSKRSRVTERTSLGSNANLHGIHVVGGGSLKIGDNFHAAHECEIHTHNHNYDEGDAIPYDDTMVCKDVKIGDNVWIGARVMIVPGVTIGEGAIIQAGSTVTGDIPKGAIAGGHPAEVFDYRDMDHYEQLKEEGKFN